MSYECKSCERYSKVVSEEDLRDWEIYHLADDIRLEVKKLTGENIPDWSGAFQVISDIAHSCLFGTLSWDAINLADIHSDLTYAQVHEILRYLGYAS